MDQIVQFIQIELSDWADEARLLQQIMIVTYNFLMPLFYNSIQLTLQRIYGWMIRKQWRISYQILNGYAKDLEKNLLVLIYFHPDKWDYVTIV